MPTREDIEAVARGLAVVGGAVPIYVVRDTTGGAAAAWRVSGLPDTFVVRDGRVVGRMGGPREWGTAEARGFLRELRSAP